MLFRVRDTIGESLLVELPHESYSYTDCISMRVLEISLVEQIVNGGDCDYSLPKIL